MKRHVFVLLKSLGFFALWLLLYIVSASIPVIFEPPFIKEPAFSRLWWEVLPLISVIISTLLFVKIIEGNKISMGIYDKIIKNGLLGIITGIIWIGIPVLIVFLLGSISFGKINYIPYLFVWIISALINVIMQEYLVRGYLFSLLKKEYSILTAIIITTISFTLLHGGAFEAGVIAVINVISMSVFASLLLVYTNNLIVPIITHGIWNIIGSLMSLVSLAEDYPILINSAITGNKIITGGEYKLEGSIIVLIINVISIIIFMVLIKNRGIKIWGKSNCT